METGLWIFIIATVVSLIILKKSWEYDAFPWGLMLVVGIFGFLFFGIWGLLIGIFVVGAIINFALITRELPACKGGDESQVPHRATIES